MNIAVDQLSLGRSLTELTVTLVSAYVSRNSVPAPEVPNLIFRIHAALDKVGRGSAEPGRSEPQRPAVNPKRSVFNDYLICLEDGRKFKSLKRHLRTLKLGQLLRCGFRVNAGDRKMGFAGLEGLPADIQIQARPSSAHSMCVQ